MHSFNMGIHSDNIFKLLKISFYTSRMVTSKAEERKERRAGKEDKYQTKSYIMLYWRYSIRGDCNMSTTGEGNGTVIDR